MSLEKTQDPTSIPWDPNNTSFPLRKDCIQQPDQPAGACWVWGTDDNCGRLNLLTPTRVLSAARLIRTGQTISLDLPTHLPLHPSNTRQPFTHKIQAITPGLSYDDIYTLNTQSGTQLDGFRHAAHQATGIFYNGTKAEHFTKDGASISEKCSIHHFRDNGFTGRGVLLDYRAYADHMGIQYDSETSHEITYHDLVETGKFQGGLDIRPASQGGNILPGDILMVRSGWTADHLARTTQENKTIAERTVSTWVGLKPEPEIIDWLHDCYFAAVAGDMPAFEVWPPQQSSAVRGSGGVPPSEMGLPCLHEFLLALWGVPIGEVWDLERVAEVARGQGRWSVFVSCAPFRTVGGVASWVNGSVIF